MQGSAKCHAPFRGLLPVATPSTLPPSAESTMSAIPLSNSSILNSSIKAEIRSTLPYSNGLDPFQAFSGMLRAHMRLCAIALAVDGPPIELASTP